jgi:hypothetical protein
MPQPPLTDAQPKPTIAGRDERMEILTLIARAQIVWEKPATASTPSCDLKPDFGERRQAIAELNKMDCAYQDATTQTEMSPYRTIVLYGASQQPPVPST